MKKSGFSSNIIRTKGCGNAFPPHYTPHASTWKAYLLLKRQLKNKKCRIGVCYNIILISGSAAGYRGKQSDNRMMHLHWTKSVLS